MCSQQNLLKAVVEQDLDAIQQICNSSQIFLSLNRSIDQLVLLIINPWFRSIMATRYGFQESNKYDDIFILTKLATANEMAPHAINVLITMFLDNQVEVWTRGPISLTLSEFSNLRISCESFKSATALQFASISFREYLSSITPATERFFTAVNTLLQSGGRDYFSSNSFTMPPSTFKILHRIRYYIAFWIAKSNDKDVEAHHQTTLFSILTFLLRLATMIEDNGNTFLHYVSEYGGSLYVIKWAISQSGQYHNQHYKN